jgi:hypothetical protein
VQFANVKRQEAVIRRAIENVGEAAPQVSGGEQEIRAKIEKRGQAVIALKSACE